MNKKFYYLLTSLILILFLLLNTVAAVDASKTGLLLWFYSLVPALLPFMILSNLIIQLDGISSITTWCYPLFHRLLGTSQNGSYAVMVGFFCGYPMGAKVVSDLIKEAKISLAEGNYLLSFCNNVSPSFFLSFCMISCLNQPTRILPGVILLYGTPLVLSFFFRKGGSFSNIKKIEKASGFQISFKIVDACIMNALENILKLGCYCILFSILARLIALIPFFHPMVSACNIGIIEITNGVLALSSLSLENNFLSFTLVLTIISFGGLSGIAQTATMLSDTNLSIKSYIKAKVITACVVFIFTLLYLHHEW